MGHAIGLGSRQAGAAAEAVMADGCIGEAVWLWRYKEAGVLVLCVMDEAAMVQAQPCGCSGRLKRRIGCDGVRNALDGRGEFG